MVQKRKVKSPIQMVDKRKKTTTKKVVKPKAQPQKNFKDYLNVFEFETILPGTGEKIKFKPLNVKTLKRLLAYNIDDVTKFNELDPDVVTEIFDDLIINAVTTENFNMLDLYIQDRYHLLLEIRKKSKGETEQYKITCPKCGSQTIQKFDFEDIKSRDRREDVDFKINITPDITLMMRYPTREDEIEALQTWRADMDMSKPLKERAADAALFIEAQHINEIITPNGSEEVTIFDKKYLLEEIPQELYMVIQDWRKDNDFGPLMEMDVKCAQCDFIAKQDVTNLDFFS